MPDTTIRVRDRRTGEVRDVTEGYAQAWSHRLQRLRPEPAKTKPTRRVDESGPEWVEEGGAS